MVAGTRLHPRCADRGTAVMFQTGDRTPGGEPGAVGYPVGRMRKGCR